jgi:hypothetical protein
MVDGKPVDVSGEEAAGPAPRSAAACWQGRRRALVPPLSSLVKPAPPATPHP